MRARMPVPAARVIYAAVLGLCSPVLFTTAVDAVTAAAEKAATGEKKEGHLLGIVTNGATGKPLVGAEVVIPALRIGDVTDADGRYSIRFQQRGKYVVVCRFIGFAEVSEQIVFSRHAIEKDFSLQPKAIELEGVEVIAEREPLNSLTGSSHSVAILANEKLEEARGQTLGETIADLPGVTTLQTGPSISKPVIRGLHSQRVIVANAGLQQEGQQWGGEHAPEIDPFAPARIEVVKGAASVQYGAGAIGGVIRVEPAELDPRSPLRGLATVNGFSNNRQGAGSLSLESGIRPLPGVSWRLQGSLRRAGDSQAPRHIIRNSGFDERDWSAGLGYSSAKGEIELHYSHFGTELGIFRGSHIGNLTDLQRAIDRGEPALPGEFTYDISAPKQKISHNLLSVHAHRHFSNLGLFELRYGWQQNKRQEFDAHRRFSSEPPEDAAFDLTLTTHSAEVAFQHDPIKSVFGKLGLSGMRQGNVRASTGFLIPNFRAYSFGAYLVENWIQDRWTVNIGGRYDYRWQKVFAHESRNIPENVRAYSSLTGIISAIYQFADTWSIAANLGTAWRPPSVNELYSDGVHHGTVQFEKGDPDLAAERSINTDITLRHAGTRVRGEVSAFSNRFRNFIFLNPDADFVLTIRGAFPAFSYRQADARLRGFDGQVEVDVTNALSLSMSMSLVRGDNLDSDTPLFLMPADRLKTSAKYMLPDLGAWRKSSIELRGTLVRRQNRFVEEADFTNPPPGYGLVDLKLNTQVGAGTHPYKLQLSVQNLFNTSYRDYLSRFRYFIDDPGRSVVLRVSVPFGAKKGD